MVAALCGLAVHAHFLLVGLFGVVAIRYTGAMGPLLATCGALLVSWGIEQAYRAKWGRLSVWAKSHRRVRNDEHRAFFT